MMNENEIDDLTKDAHQEAHACYASKEVHDWVDWFDKKLKEKNR